MDRIADSFVKISIIDQGPGIPEEKLRRLGEPFYPALTGSKNPTSRLRVTEEA